MTKDGQAPAGGSEIEKEGVQKRSCPVHWATGPDKSGNYENVEVKGFRNPES
jgi:hypothetical protein